MYITLVLLLDTERNAYKKNKNTWTKTILVGWPQPNLSAYY